MENDGARLENSCCSFSVERAGKEVKSDDEGDGNCLMFELRDVNNGGLD